MSHSLKLGTVPQNLFGFMPGRGTTDSIFALRQISEKYRRAHNNRPTLLLFVFPGKSLDRVPRTVLWWCLIEKGVPGKYVELIHECTGERAFTCGLLQESHPSLMWRLVCIRV